MVRKQVPEWVERIDLDRYWRFALPVAAAALVVEGLIVASTFLPGDPPLPDGIGFSFFLVIFPVHLGTVFTEIRRNGGRAWRHPPLFGDLSGGQRVVLSGVIGAGALIAALSFLGIDGQPERHDGRYYVSEHDTLTEVSRDEYTEQRKVNQRAFTAIPAVFCAVGVGVGVGYQRRARNAAATPVDPQPGPPLSAGPGSSPSAPWPEPRLPVDVGDPPAPWPPV